jgi:hypothetical protein
MNDLTIFPADIAEMSVSQLAALPPEQKPRSTRTSTRPSTGSRRLRTKFDAALDAVLRRAGPRRAA